MTIKFECPDDFIANGLVWFLSEVKVHSIALGSAVMTEAEWGLDSLVLAEAMALYPCIPIDEYTEDDARILEESRNGRR